MSQIIDTNNEPREEPSTDNDFEDPLPPSPGTPPKHKWWNFRQRLSPDAKILLSEARVHWGWKNYQNHRPFLKKRNVLVGELQVLDERLKANHTLFMDTLAGAKEGLKKSSQEYREAATVLANEGYRYQKQSKYFTETAMYEVQARAMGRAEYPKAKRSTTEPTTTQSTSTIRRGSIDEGDRHRQQKYNALESEGDVTEAYQMEPRAGSSSSINTIR